MSDISLSSGFESFVVGLLLIALGVSCIVLSYLYAAIRWRRARPTIDGRFVTSGALGVMIGGAFCALVGLMVCGWTNRFELEKQKTLEAMDASTGSWAALTVAASFVVAAVVAIVSRRRASKRK